jgi:hypothetical protein
VATQKGKSAKGKPVAAKTKPAPKAAPKLVPHSTRVNRPTLPELDVRMPPPAPPPPPARDEMHAPRDIGRLTRYGERFGPWKIDTRLLQHIQLPVATGAFALCDPAATKSWRVLDRPSGSGLFRVMLSVARNDDGKERLAAIVIHVGRPPIAKWTVAHFRGQKKPKSADALPRVAVTTGWLTILDAGSDSPGVIATPAESPSASIIPVDIALTDGRHALALACGNGEYASYWAVDAADKPICVVVDFDVFTQKEWKARPAP